MVRSELLTYPIHRVSTFPRETGKGKKDKRPTTWLAF